MVIHHLGVLKTVAWVTGIVGAVIVALDPSVKVALIASIAPTIASMGALILGILNRNQLKVIKIDVNTNFQKLLQDKKDQDKEMATKSDQLSHAQGWKEGSQSERDKT